MQGDDPELEAIRQRRMQQLMGQYGGGGQVRCSVAAKYCCDAANADQMEIIVSISVGLIACRCMVAACKSREMSCLACDAKATIRPVKFLCPHTTHQ